MGKRDTMESFRARLAAARVEAELTIEEAAVAAGLDFWQWRSLEYQRKTPAPVPMLRRALEAVNLNADEVLREEGLL